MRELLAYGTSAPIGRITSFSAKFTDAPLAKGKFETYLHERENAKKPRAVGLSRLQLPMINGSAAGRLIDPRWSETLTKSWG